MPEKFRFPAARRFTSKPVHCNSGWPLQATPNPAYRNPLNLSPLRGNWTHMDNDQGWSKQPVYSEWIPREPGGNFDWFKVEVALRDVVAQETRPDAGGHPWIRLRVRGQTGSDYVLFRLL